MDYIYKFRIYCITESKFNHIWAYGPPSACPVNSRHAVNQNSILCINTVTKYITVVSTECPFKTTGINFYQCDSSKGNLIINLPSVKQYANRVIIFNKPYSINTLTLIPVTGETINNLLNYVLSVGTIKICSNGLLNWNILTNDDVIGENTINNAGVDINEYNKGDIVVYGKTSLTKQSAGTPGSFLQTSNATKTGIQYTTITVPGDANVAPYAGINATKIGNGSVTNKQFQYLSGVTSNIQSQLNSIISIPNNITQNALSIFETTNSLISTNIIIDNLTNVTNLGYIEFKDKTSADNPGLTKGRLYKKTGDSGLWWIADNSNTELNIAVAGTLTVNQVAQIMNIGNIAISPTQWSYLGGLDQNVNSSSTPAFNGIKLNSFLNMNSNNIVQLADPINNADAVNKTYVDARSFIILAPVCVATTQAQILVSDFQNGSTIDGKILTIGNRILIKNQANGIENGIYVVNITGMPTRSSDMGIGESASKVFTMITDGATNNNTIWTCALNQNSATVGLNNLIFTIFSDIKTIIYNNGLTFNPILNQASVDSDNNTINLNSNTNKLQIINAPKNTGDLFTSNGTTQTCLPVGANNLVLVADSSKSVGMRWGNISTINSSTRTWIMLESQPLGTNGGSAIGNNIWTQRNLNIMSTNGGSDVSLATNKVTCLPGSYFINAHSTFYQVGSARIRAYNITNSTIIAYSTCIYSPETPIMASSTAYLIGHFVVDNEVTFQIEYSCSTARDGDGLGISSGVEPEIYTVVQLVKF